ncbi:CFI-box-CTERM domain-containing protein [Nitrosopumilus sp. Nsub]|uniref:CFI-box-CTERM domain-containing protein n=1 Tax=Nitrosopumilus sp. Nsub TaxID=1776294 RepID=UPI000B046D2C|nr:CFI-box-CTERM domain-containing protein [Nitrosopumilus sp. Nsub]
MSAKNFLILSMIFCLLFPASSVYGHGLGIDTISSINIQEKQFSVSIEMPMYFENEQEQITITATDNETDENVNNVTYLIGVFYKDEMILRNYFFAENGILPITVKPTNNEDITIVGEKDSLLGAWHGTESKPLEITGPIFNSGGLYTFEIEIRTIDEPTNIIEDSGVYTADLTIVESKSFLQKDQNNQDVEFGTKSYFDSISNFQYDYDDKEVTFEMPFDWNESQMSHVNVIHVETQFPKDFEEFLSPSYTGYVNDIKLFKSSVTVDDYTYDDDRTVHFVLLQDHLRHLKNEMRKSEQPLPDKIEFKLIASQETKFPLIAYSASEEFKVNLAWDPKDIEVGVPTNFVFTIRDSYTDSPMRLSDYTFVIIQNNEEIHRVSDNAEVGGDFEKFTFSEGQTGPTIVKFENIRNTGQETEFAFVVVEKTFGEKKVEQVVEEPVAAPQESSEEGGGCLIATATYGSELAPQVQMLREIRDNQLMNTESGKSFMSGFNELYYTFSPTIADMERQSPVFKEIVKAGLTPMISTLSIMENAETESEVLGLGLSVIALNLGMYIGLPAFGIVKAIQFRKKLVHV